MEFSDVDFIDDDGSGFKLHHGQFAFKDAAASTMISRRFQTSLRRFSSANSHPLVDWTVETLGNNTNKTVGILTISAPQQYNALTVEMGIAFQSKCRNPPENISAVIVRGAGDKAFSAGGDRQWLLSLRDNPIHINVDLMLEFYKSFLCIRTLAVPTIAAMTGPAIGAGAGLALACDVRVACECKQLLGVNFSKLGIHTGMGGLHFLQRIVPQSGIANELILSGKTLTSFQCQTLGVINRLVEQPSDVLPAALKLAEELVGVQHPVAIRTLVRSMRTEQDVGLEQALQRDAYAQAVCYAREDWGEGIQAVVEKRIPEFGDYQDK